MDWRDSATQIAHIAVVAMALAVIPFCKTCPYFGQLIGMAVILAVANWLIGSQWSIRLGQLAETGAT